MSLREAEVDIKIRGIVSIVPNQKIENTFFKNHLNPKTIKDVTRITGVKTRYWAKENQTTSRDVGEIMQQSNKGCCNMPNCGDSVTPSNAKSNEENQLKGLTSKGLSTDAVNESIKPQLIRYLSL